MYQDKEKRIKLHRSYEEDIVCEKYKILLDKHHNEYSNDFVQYYDCIGYEDGNNDYLALVYDISFCPTHVLNVLKENNIKNVIRPLDFGITRLSTDKTYRLVVIIEKYDCDSTLYDFLLSGNRFSEKELSEKVLDGIIKVINFCHKNEISCGNINPHNILINEDRILLREIFVNPYHYYQKDFFLSPELLMCTDNISRSSNNVSYDIYALGVLLCFCSRYPDLSYKRNSFVDDRFKSGSVKQLLDFDLYSDKSLLSFIENALDHNFTSRLNCLSWNLNRNFGYSGNSVSKDFNFNFNGLRISNVDHLCYEVTKNWEEFNRVISQDDFGKVVSNFTRNQSKKNRSIENIDIFSLRQKQHDASEYSLREKILNSISSDEVIKTNGLVADIKSLGNVLLYNYLQKKQYLCSKVLHIIKNCLWKHIQTHKHLDISLKLEKVRDMCNFEYSIFSMERILYELNVDLPCLSKFVSSEYITNEVELLTELESIAAKSYDKVFIDLGTIAFLASRLNFNDTSHFVTISKIGILNQNNFFVCLLLMINDLKEKKNNLSLPNLCRYIAFKIDEVISKGIHNTNIRRIVSDSIIEASRNEDTQKIIDIITDRKIYINDELMYANACIEIAKINKQIDKIDKNDMGLAIFYAQKITTFVSYTIFLLTTIIIVIT